MPAKKVVGFIMLLLVLLLANGALAATTPLLKTIDGQRWYIDVGGTVAVNEQARVELERLGREAFASRYAQAGVMFELSGQIMVLYSEDGEEGEPIDFKIISQSERHASLVHSGDEGHEINIRLELNKDLLKVRLLKDNNETAVFFRRR